MELKDCLDLGIPPAKVVVIFLMSYRWHSLEEGELIKHLTALSAEESEALEKVVNKILLDIPYVNREAVKLYYGFGTNMNPLRKKEISILFNVVESTIHQRYMKGMMMLRHPKRIGQLKTFIPVAL